MPVIHVYSEGVGRVVLLWHAEAFSAISGHLRSLSFADTPNYAFLRSCLQQLPDHPPPQLRELPALVTNTLQQEQPANGQFAGPIMLSSAGSHHLLQQQQQDVLLTPASPPWEQSPAQMAAAVPPQPPVGHRVAAAAAAAAVAAGEVSHDSPPWVLLLRQVCNAALSIQHAMQPWHIYHRALC